MITDADIKKMKTVFATKEDLKKFATKDELSSVVRELIAFIGSVKTDLSNQLIEFRNEMNDFRGEMRDITRTHQSTLDIHEVRLNRLEYVNK